MEAQEELLAARVVPVVAQALVVKLMPAGLSDTRVWQQDSWIT
jgi:hypothetical protein